MALNSASRRSLRYRVILHAASAWLVVVIAIGCVSGGVSGMIGVSRVGTSVIVWLAPCKGSDVTGLALLQLTDSDISGEFNWTEKKEDALWSARWPSPPEPATRVNLNALPEGAQTTGKLPDIRGDEEFTVLVTHGTTGGFGFSNLSFTFEDLRTDRIWFDGRSVSKRAFRSKTSSQCQ
ncbi:hypothetical protein IMCC26207_1058 [Actinobacteria bacterium IMCC26207]|nr:hypothetical protein IMCC26207_1058 [Actinobacteria bacterium IMCC26207]